MSEKMDIQFEKGIEMCKAEIKSLIAMRSYRKSDYLLQFNSHFREKLEPRISSFENNKPQPELNFVEAKCTRCKKTYKSQNVLEELGNCDSCLNRDLKEFMKLNPIQHYKYKKRNNPRSLMPFWIGEPMLTNIQRFFAENYYVKRTFKFKFDAVAPINEKFGLSLSVPEVLSLASIGALRAKGLPHKH